MQTLLQTADILRQLNDLSDVDLIRLIILMFIAFIVVSGVVAGFVTAIMTLILKRGSKREDDSGIVIRSLVELVAQVGEDYRNAQTRFDAMRTDSVKADENTLQAINNVSTAVQDNSRKQADRAIEAVGDKIDSSSDLIIDELKKQRELIEALDTKIDVKDVEARRILGEVKAISEESVQLLKARETTTGELSPVKIETIIASPTPFPDDAA